MTTDALLPALTARVRQTAHARTAACPCGAAAEGDATLADRPDG
ncbi:aminoglycoside phosphotransferase family protein, partial [Streptomyces rochei]|nr:aminoglycoside phosphotransferase family protein [Streptomyces rochei]